MSPPFSYYFCTMARALAIDYGLKRTGIAVTDPVRIIASPLTTVRTHDLVDFLKDYFSKENVDDVAIGYPVQLNNEPSEMVKHIDPFIKRFMKTFPGIRIHRVDERFTSSIAQQAIIEGGMKLNYRRNKANVDKISASLILQSWLEQQKRF